MRKLFSWIGGAKGKGSGFSWISIGNVLVAFFAYLRFAEITKIFGTSWETDAVAIAMVIPLLLQKLISTAFGIAFLPIYSRVRQAQGFQSASLLVSRIINWMSATGFLFIGITALLGGSISHLIGPGAEPETISLATRMLYVFLPLIFLNAIEGVLQNFLNYENRYALVSFVRVLQIFVSYIVLVLGHEEYGIMIVPISGLIGAIASFAGCAVLAYLRRLRLHPVFDPKDSDFRELIRMAIPILIGVTTGLLAPVADKVLASYLPTSSITAIDYASRIRNMVRLVLIQPVIVLSTVSLSKIAATADMVRLKREVADYIKDISFYAIPVAGFLVVMATPMVSIFFQRGNFGPDESRMVGYALAFYSPWFAQVGISVVLRRTFFSLKDAVTPVFLGVWSIVANILLNIILIGPMGIGGLALATTITSAIKALFLLYFLRKKLNGIHGSEFLPEVLRILSGTFVMIGFLVLAGRLLPFDLTAGFSTRALNVCVVGLPAIVVYLLVTALTGSSSYKKYARALKNRLPGK